MRSAHGRAERAGDTLRFAIFMKALRRNQCSAIPSYSTRRFGHSFLSPQTTPAATPISSSGDGAGTLVSFVGFDFVIFAFTLFSPPPRLSFGDLSPDRSATLTPYDDAPWSPVESPRVAVRSASVSAFFIVVPIITGAFPKLIFHRFRALESPIASDPGANTRTTRPYGYTPRQTIRTPPYSPRRVRFGRLEQAGTSPVVIAGS